MNKQIAFEELLEVLKHLRQDEMRLERIAYFQFKALEQEMINKAIEEKK
jgi:hypothetical protein